MRTQTEVEGREVIAVYAKQASTHLKITPAAFTIAVRKSGIGKTQEKRYFLARECKDRFIKKDINTVRQSCCAVFLDALPECLATEL